MNLNRRETVTLLVGDFFVLVVSLWVALLIRNLAIPPLGYFEANVVPFLPMFGISLGIFYIAGLYEKQTRPIRRVMSARILGAQAATVVVAAFLFFILPLSIAPKTILLLFLIVSVIAITAWRFYRMQREIRPEDRERATLYGSSPAALELYDEIQNNDRYLIRFDARHEVSGPERVEIHTKGGTTVVSLSAMYEEVFDRVPIDLITTEEFLAPLSAPRRAYDVAKRLFDIILALLLAVVAIPFILVAGVLLAIQGGMPIFYSERVGRGGVPFRLVKLRSMLFNDQGDPVLREKNRVTAFGRLIRKTRIDELPQLWNVIRGDLSFIGPRPELPALVAVYEKEVPQYQLRHLIAPGLSGWAQIHDYDAPRGGADVVRTRKKLSFDLYYLKHRSFGLDLAIALKTLRALVSISGV